MHGDITQPIDQNQAASNPAGPDDQIKWQEYQPQVSQSAMPTGKVALDHVKLLVSQDIASENLSPEQFSDYLGKIGIAVEHALSDTTTPFQLMLQFELRPTGDIRLQIANQGDTSRDILQKIYDSCPTLAAPRPSSQPIAFQVIYKIK